MPEQQITGFPVQAAPNSRVTKDSETFELLAVNATFDGSGSGSAYLPAVEVVSDAGVVVARHVTGSTVAAGASAEVTFAPFLRGATAAAPTPVGKEIDYVQRTTSLTIGGTLTTVIAGNGHTYSGAERVRIDFFSPQIASNNVAFAQLALYLFDGSTVLGVMAAEQTQSDAFGNYSVCFATRFLTPSAGFHTYSVKAQGNGTGAGGTILAGTGTSGNFMPAFYRITTA